MKLERKSITFLVIGMMLVIPISAMGQNLKTCDTKDNSYIKINGEDDSVITYGGFLRIRVNIDPDENLNNQDYFSVVYIQFNDGNRVRLEGSIKGCTSRMIYLYRSLDGVLTGRTGSITVNVEIRKSTGGGWSETIQTDEETGSYWGPFVFI